MSLSCAQTIAFGTEICVEIGCTSCLGLHIMGMKLRRELRDNDVCGGFAMMAWRESRSDTQHHTVIHQLRRPSTYVADSRRILPFLIIICLQMCLSINLNASQNREAPCPCYSINLPANRYLLKRSWDSPTWQHKPRQPRRPGTLQHYSRDRPSIIMLLYMLRNMSVARALAGIDFQTMIRSYHQPVRPTLQLTSTSEASN